jgi:hypothetical protein
MRIFLNGMAANAIYIYECRCSFRVGREVMLVVRFEQREIVDLITLLSASVKAY